jgi:hypothetical protein
VLVAFVPACGMDASEYEPHLRALPYRCIAITPYGFEPGRKRRPSIPLTEHFVMMRELLRHAVERARTEVLVVAGFSSGGDIALRLPIDQHRVRIDGVLSLGGNVSLDTCFLTKVVSRFRGSNAAEMLSGLRAVGDTARSVDEWLNTHAYLVAMMGKFQSQIDALRHFARDIVTPFERASTAFGSDVEQSPFVEWYRGASAAVRAVRCVFEDTDVLRTQVGQILTRNLDTPVLGEHYREGSVVIEPGTNHFDLAKPELVARHLESLVAEARGAVQATA